MAHRIVDVGPCGQAIDEATLQQAADVIREGGIVAFPTDTLYGRATQQPKRRHTLGLMYFQS